MEYILIETDDHQNSDEKPNNVKCFMPRRIALSMVRRAVSTPFSWPMARGNPFACAHRPFPSIIIATCRGSTVISTDVCKALVKPAYFPLPLPTTIHLFCLRERL